MATTTKTTVEGIDPSSIPHTVWKGVIAQIASELIKKGINPEDIMSTNIYSEYSITYLTNRILVVTKTTNDKFSLVFYYEEP